MEALNRNANRVMNSLIPMNAPANSSSNIIYNVISVILVAAIFVAIFYYFRDSIRELTDATMDTIGGYFKEPTLPILDASGDVVSSSYSSVPAPGSPLPPEPAAREPTPPAPAPAAPAPPAPVNDEAPAPPPAPVPEPETSYSIMGKLMPGTEKGPEVFNISSNKFTYYDAEPLCSALGAELATYDQVKDAWSKGADWCNYGWIKGQMAVYPTSDNTYEKLQKGPAEQQLACGRPGVNGGYFDNPELRYGVTCYGKKPVQSKHDQARAAMATPLSPDAVEFDKKVAKFKSEADSIGVLPFNESRW
jgi:hypothetical protein